MDFGQIKCEHCFNRFDDRVGDIYVGAHEIPKPDCDPSGLAMAMSQLSRPLKREYPRIKVEVKEEHQEQSVWVMP